MKLLSCRTMRGAAVAAIATAAGLAHAHTGHGATTLFEGLAHPLALDHLLAAAAVGFWSVAALPDRKIWHGPAAFLLALVAGAMLAMLHGLAHGAEAPAAGFASYAAGFLVTTIALQLGAVLTGVAMRRFGSVRARAMVASIGALLGGAGLYLFTQI